MLALARCIGVGGYSHVESLDRPTVCANALPYLAGLFQSLFIGVVVFGAKWLPIVLAIPHQRLIALVGDDVVDHCGDGYSALVLAHSAERMQAEVD